MLAFNDIDKGPLSDSVSIIAATVPGPPQTPTLQSQSKTQIGITWNDPVDLGGTPLQTYLIQMDGGTTSGVTEFSTIATQSNASTDQFVTNTV